MRIFLATLAGLLVLACLKGFIFGVAALNWPGINFSQGVSSLTLFVGPLSGLLATLAHFWIALLFARLSGLLWHLLVDHK